MTPNGETKNDVKEVAYLTQFVGRDGHLIFEIEAAKPVTMDTSEMLGEFSILIGAELFTVRLGQDEMVTIKGRPQFRTEQFKIGDT